MTLKEILDDVLLLAGAGTEASYVGNGNDAVERVVALANRSAAYFNQYPWQGLRKRHEFTLTSATQYELPDDFLAFIPDTMYSDDYVLPADFPAGEGFWAYLKATEGGTDARYHMRWLGDMLEIYQPDAGQTVSFEYYSNHPVLDSDGLTTKQRFEDDDDTFRLDDELLIRDVLWRYKKLVGIEDWQVDAAEFKAFEVMKKGQDGGSQTIYPSEGHNLDGDPFYNMWRPVPNV